MDKTDIGWNCLSKRPPVTISLGDYLTVARVFDDESHEYITGGAQLSVNKVSLGCW